MSYSKYDMQRDPPLKEEENKKQESRIDDDAVDFKQMFKDHKERTEVERSYTKMNREDVIFVDSKKLISLEYFIYQKDSSMHRIKPESSRLKVKPEHPLGTDDYDVDKLNEKSCFK